MLEPLASSLLAAWSSFYVLTGSAAAALTGLMFVVITLVMGTNRVRRSRDGISTFSTPTVAHFGAALLISAVLSAPWHSLIYPAIVLGLAGLYGVVYVLRLMYRTKRITAYDADFEDWAWYNVLPMVAYGAMVIAAILLFSNISSALFVFAAAVALLIFIGIRNAWDIVTYIAISDAEEPSDST